MDRSVLIARLREKKTHDLIVVGGGATGLGVALDAAARGFSVVLLEAHDFAKGTSSRSTKLVHGGVRYLAQGNIGLVREALRERSLLLRNAPHLAHALPFVMPSYAWWQAPFYGLGLKAYDVLAGRAGLGATEFLSRRDTLRALPNVEPAGLKGGVRYWDGQFDDARLALALARSAHARGALLLNYCAVNGLLHEGGRLVGVRCAERETGEAFTLRARCVINATGVWVDELRRQDGAAVGAAARPMVAPSQGVHLVVDRDFWPGEHALLVPRTTDGRVLFAVPWLGKVILGTTDTPRPQPDLEPRPLHQEVDFILGEAGRFLHRAPTRADVRSAWVGLRPLVKPPGEETGGTQRLSREHTVTVSRSGLVSVTGGKWTTYRAMAEDVLARCADAGLLPATAAGATAHLPLWGAPEPAAAPMSDLPPELRAYGTEAPRVLALPGARQYLADGLSEAMVRHAVQSEYARTVEDVLARRSRLLFLDAGQAERAAPAVGAVVAQETGRDPRVEAFVALAREYQRLA